MFDNTPSRSDVENELRRDGYEDDGTGYFSDHEHPWRTTYTVDEDGQRHAEM